ncbi:MAG: hypothetical protein EHM70_01035 [Chloroflexota bacterium]|nr:MAG: hypothetical protein EHM70_01035 [Chloroflexota bacterium]
MSTSSATVAVSVNELKIAASGLSTTSVCTVHQRTVGSNDRTIKWVRALQAGFLPNEVRCAPWGY